MILLLIFLDHDFCFLLPTGVDSNPNKTASASNSDVIFSEPMNLSVISLSISLNFTVEPLTYNLASSRGFFTTA